MKIAVSGVGVVSCLGIGVEKNIDALSHGRSGIVKPLRYLSTRHDLPCGEVPYSNAELASILGLDSKSHLSRTAMLGMLAAKEALDSAAVSAGLRVGLVSATSVGGMDLTENFFRSFMKDEASGRLRDVRMHDCHASTEAIAGHCGITGYRTTISTACSSAANAIMLGARLIRHGVLDCVVVGGTDALSVFTINGFKSLMILDENPCRPFDATRTGLNLGEGAGYLVLQSEETLSSEPYCYLSGWANSNDAFHQTASSPEGEGDYLAMKGALEMGGLTPDEVSYVNAHGTGTLNNDSSEGSAMKRLFADKMPLFSSTKPFTGHTLAAAGGIEAVYSALAIRNRVVWPGLNFHEPSPDLELVPQTEFLEDADVDAVLSNSFGFGGNCSSLLFTGCRK